MNQAQEVLSSFGVGNLHGLDTEEVRALRARGVRGLALCALPDSIYCQQELPQSKVFENQPRSYHRNNGNHGIVLGSSERPF